MAVKVSRKRVCRDLRAALSVLILIGIFTTGCSEGRSDGRIDGRIEGRDGTKLESAAGGKTYQRFCFSCHQAGIAGAPRIGDAGAWAERMEKGAEPMLQRVIAGIPPGMPKKGMCLQCSEQDLRDAIAYMLEQSRQAF